MITIIYYIYVYNIYYIYYIFYTNINNNYKNRTLNHNFAIIIINTKTPFSQCEKSQ